jgi:hypothetical protein
MTVEGLSGRHDPSDGPVDPGEVRQLVVALEAQRIGADAGDQRLRQSISLAVRRQTTARAN